MRQGYSLRISVPFLGKSFRYDPFIGTWRLHALVYGAPSHYRRTSATVLC